MSTEKGREKDFLKIGSRLLELVHELADGNKANFAKKSAIPKTTFYGYIDGRNPKIEHLLKIRDTYQINLDWLISGEGPKGFSETKKHNFPVLNELDKWLSEIVVNEPYRRDWFNATVDDAIPMFKEWKKRKEEQESKNPNIPNKNVA